ncbi:MAG: hut operon transcriptional regulator HutP [Dethiobacter sp.]|jgi:hut operon positive regulator|nr:hut operon transcriptional regulator HutP [Dethiobacter sp.]
MKTLGQVALRVVLEEEDSYQSLIEEASKMGFLVARGKVGSMNMEKVIAAVETTAKRQGLISENYREEHALYHAVLEALSGICRGQLALGNILRTVGLRFTIVKGPKKHGEQNEGVWIAVVLYGTIGAPIKGFEHEALGLGINHI